MALWSVKQRGNMCNFRFPPHCKWDVRSSGISSSVDWQLQTFRYNLSEPSSRVKHSKQKCWTAFADRNVHALFFLILPWYPNKHVFVWRLAEYLFFWQEKYLDRGNVLLVDENIEILGKNSPTCHSSHLNSHGLDRDRSTASAVRGRRCTDCPLTLPTTVMTIVPSWLFWEWACDYSEDHTKCKYTAYG